MKVNYEELKKILVKEYSASQAQMILAQHAANNGIGPGGPHANSQSQDNFFSLNSMNSV